MNVLETQRLILRHLAVEDAAFFLGLLNEPSFLRYIGDRGVRTLADARTYILKGPVDSYQRLGFGLYLVQLKADGVAIGICGLVKRTALQDVDVGFAFLPQFWSKGYALESGAAVVAHARDVIGLKRLAAITSMDNEASIRMLGKLGFKFERRIRLAGDAEELYLFTVELDIEKLTVDG